ncbi:MAG: GAF domain-containing protein [Homoserinimonas sp.]
MTDGTSSLAFPDAPRSKLDLVLAELVEAAQDVLATQGRLRSLLNASRAVSGELDLPAVLRRIIEAAVELVGAQYGAVGVIAPDGSLEQFIHVGMPDDLVAQIGHLPEGHGLLGALIDERAPIRLEHLSEDPRSSGFPTHHPPMDSFLGVPIRVRNEVYGNIYLSESKAGSFSEEDQELLISLASTAGAAIDHARLFDESRRRQEWAAASAEVTAALLSEQPDDSLAILADRVVSLAGADLVCVTLPRDQETMAVEVARGPLAPSFVGMTFKSAGTLAGRALESGNPILSEAVINSRIDPQVSIGPTMAVPLTASDHPGGVLIVSRLPGKARFTTADLDMAADFAAQASLAIRIANGQADRHRLALLEDRERIARDLHDHVIQRLFGVGLRLQAIAGTVQDPPGRRAIIEQVNALDTTISEIRTAIFTLTTEPDAVAPSVRHQVIDLLGEMAGILEEPPRVAFAGAVDLMVPTTMVDDMVAVVREGLSNVARHARARDTAVSISVDHGVLSVVIEDDGEGMGVGHGGDTRGMSNLSERAARFGGHFQVLAREPKGTTLKWTVPIPDEAAPT